MVRPEVPPEENIVRAIHSAWWDSEANRKHSSIFKGENISVSRLSILGLDELFRIFHKQLDSSPNGVIVGAGEIKVRRIKEIGKEHENPINLTVEEYPLDYNLAHAEIPQKISRGLANRIIKELLFRKDDNVILSDFRS